MFGYRTEDLYFGVLGYVTKQGNKLLIEKREIYIIYKKVAIECGDYVAKEVFSNQIYYFFQGNIFDSNTICKAINSLAIHVSIPLSTLYRKDWISKKGLMKIQNDIEKYFEEKNKKLEIPELPITDSILQMILETSKKVKEAYIEENLKQQLLSDLGSLGEYYVNEVINKMNSEFGINLNIDNEYTIKMEVMKRLVEIEEIYKNPSNEKAYSLKKQLTQFRKSVK